MKLPEGRDKKHRIGRALRFWLDARAPPGRILRGSERDEDVLTLSLFGMGFFLAHWEETVQDRPLAIMVYPVGGLPAHWVPWAWAVTAVVMVFNSWWLDRWLARESGVERELRPRMRWFRKILAAVPILGFLIIPIWRWLIVRRPRWAFAEETPSAFTLLAEQGADQGTSPGQRLLRWFDRQHARLSPALVLGVWHFITGFAMLRFAVAEISEMRLDGGKWVLLASIAGLRLLGLSLNGALLWTWYRDRGRPVWKLLWQLPLAIGWFLPLRLAYLQALLGWAFLDQRWQRLRLVSRARSRPFSSENQDVKLVGPAWKWFMGQLRFDELNRPQRARTTAARCLTSSKLSTLLSWFR